MDTVQALGVLREHTHSLRERLLSRQQENSSGLKLSPAWLGMMTLITPSVDKSSQLVIWQGKLKQATEMQS